MIFSVGLHSIYHYTYKKFTYPMKLRYLLGFLCLAVITFTACQKDKAVLASGTCTFTFGGTAYSANTTSGTVSDTTIDGKKSKALLIQGVTGTLSQLLVINIIFPDTLVTGTYTETSGATIMFSPVLVADSAYLNNQATVKITSINSKYAEGTFSGILINGDKEKPLTDGTFEVNIY